MIAARRPEPAEHEGLHRIRADQVGLTDRGRIRAVECILDPQIEPLAAAFAVQIHMRPEVDDIGVAILLPAEGCKLIGLEADVLERRVDPDGSDGR
jgi:hypothetical protein